MIWQCSKPLQSLKNINYHIQIFSGFVNSFSIKVSFNFYDVAYEQILISNICKSLQKCVVFWWNWNFQFNRNWNSIEEYKYSLNDLTLINSSLTSLFSFKFIPPYFMKRIFSSSKSSLPSSFFLLFSWNICYWFFRLFIKMFFFSNHFKKPHSSENKFLLLHHTTSVVLS